MQLRVIWGSYLTAQTPGVIFIFHRSGGRNELPWHSDKGPANLLFPMFVMKTPS